jgi:hypothetical protein
MGHLEGMFIEFKHRLLRRNVSGRAILILKLRSPDVFPIPAEYLANATHKAAILSDGNGKARNTVVRDPYSPEWFIRYRMLQEEIQPTCCELPSELEKLPGYTSEIQPNIR